MMQVFVSTVTFPFAMIKQVRLKPDFHEAEFSLEQGFSLELFTGHAHKLNLFPLEV